MQNRSPNNRFPFFPTPRFPNPFRILVPMLFLSLPSAFSTSVTVGPNGYPTLTEALAAINRRDGIPDIIDVSADRIGESSSLLLDFRDGANDPLIIRGNREDNKNPIIAFSEGIGPSAISIHEVPGTQLTFQNLTLIPEPSGEGQMDFPHCAIRMEGADSGVPIGNSFLESHILLENVVIAAANPDGTPLDSNHTPPSEYTRWSQPFSGNGFSGVGIEFGSVENRNVRIALRNVSVGHTIESAIRIEQGAGVLLEMQGCSLRFSEANGLVALGANGKLLLQDCTLSDNGRNGFFLGYGEGSVTLRNCVFDLNAERALHIGGGATGKVSDTLTKWGFQYTGSSTGEMLDLLAGWMLHLESPATAPVPDILIEGGGFKRNGFSGVSYPLYVEGNGGSLSIRGTELDPVLFQDNLRHAIRIENAAFQFREVLHTVFAGNSTWNPGPTIDLLSLDLSTGPAFERCAFLNSRANAFVSLTAWNRNPVTVSFRDCTFYNLILPSGNHISLPNAPRTWAVTLDVERCIFAGGSAEKGRDEKAFFIDGTNCIVESRDCAFVTTGPHAMSTQYAISNVSGSGNVIREIDCIHEDPGFARTRYFRSVSPLLSNQGPFLRIHSESYRKDNTPGGVDIGGYSKQIFSPLDRPEPIRVGLYMGEGAMNQSRLPLEIILNGCREISLSFLYESDFRNQNIDHLDVILIPGGATPTIADALGETGRQAIRNFVGRGGGYVGICAGAYLATLRPNYLGILNGTWTWNIDPEQEDTLVEIELTGEGKRLLQDSRQTTDIFYAGGPPLRPLGDPHLPEYIPLAYFSTPVVSPPPEPRTLTAIAAAEYGEGRVLVFSPHPECTESPVRLGKYIYRAVLWTSGLSMPEYPNPSLTLW